MPKNRVTLPLFKILSYHILLKIYLNRPLIIPYTKVYTSTIQGWEFAHSLIAHLLICSLPSNQMSDCERFAQITQDKWATVSKWLRSLKTNEQPWANGSGRSWQKSDRERFAQVAHDKWANELFAQKIWLTKYKILFFSMFYILIFILKNEQFHHSLIFGERCERIVQVAHQKWVM